MGIFIFYNWHNFKLMKKISGWFTTILIIALIISAFTIPAKEKLEQQLKTQYGDTVHVSINETQIKILAPLAIICSYNITGSAKPTTFKLADGKPLAVARFIKRGTYLGLFGRFWEWE